MVTSEGGSIPEDSITPCGCARLCARDRARAERDTAHMHAHAEIITRWTGECALVACVRRGGPVHAERGAGLLAHNCALRFSAGRSELKRSSSGGYLAIRRG